MWDKYDYKAWFYVVNCISSLLAAFALFLLLR